LDENDLHSSIKIETDFSIFQHAVAKVTNFSFPVWLFVSLKKMFQNMFAFKNTFVGQKCTQVGKRYYSDIKNIILLHWFMREGIPNQE
jgi:hypothetical protein